MELVMALIGALGWTLAEYLIHRYLGHQWRTLPTPFGQEHTRHHSQGDYFAPSWKKAIAALIAFAILSGAAWVIVDFARAMWFASGFVAMYIAYEVTHRRAHTHRGFGRYGRFLRRHHFFHHFANPSKNYGVTTPVWDFVFRSFAPSPRIRVPERLKMQWLVDPVSDEVWPELQDTYALARSKRAGA